MDGNYAELIRKLKRIDALLERPSTEGERQAALNAKKTIESKLNRVLAKRAVVIRKYEFVAFNTRTA